MALISLFHLIFIFTLYNTLGRIKSKANNSTNYIISLSRKHQISSSCPKMVTTPPQKALKKPLKTLTVTISLLCSLSYILSSYKSLIFQTNPGSQFTELELEQQFLKSFQEREKNHSLTPPLEISQTRNSFPLCPPNYTDYCPCQDPYRASLVNPTKSFHKERHCPRKDETLRCLVPKPEGYERPFSWPKSRDYARFKNVPFPRLTVLKKSQNWVRLEGGDRLVFPGGGTSFAKGVGGYVKEISRIVPLNSGDIRIALDVGCGVASFAAALTEFNILTMSIAPRDIHEAQVQFALERGLPAMLGVLSIYRLPFPARSFDMAHCSRCLVPWTSHDGLFLMEIDRVLRPGGYFILSGPPINWKFSYKGWERTVEDLKNEQNDLEDLARRLCWKKVQENGPIAVWQKPTNHIHCAHKMKSWKVPKFCADVNPDAGWYKKTEACITRLPNVNTIQNVSGGALKPWPKRLNTASPRITSMGISLNALNDDNQMWKMRVLHYGSVVKSLFNGEYRNIMDMNAGIGGFAASLQKYPLWVMNVVPFHIENNTLGIIYERGLIGTYMNWCEPFSTYPRTYDFIHADCLFSMYMDKCDIVDILIEMYRILRPFGAVVIRDHVDTILKLKSYMDQMGWKGKLSHTLEGPTHTEKILFIDNAK